MKTFQQNLSKLEASDTQVLGVSMDSPFSNKAWADKIGVSFPLLSDWGGDTTKKYGLYNQQYKAPRRATFLIGKDGRLTRVFVKVTPKGHAEEVAAALVGNRE